MSDERYDPRNHIAELLRRLFPMWEEKKLGEAAAPYDELVGELGLARMMVIGEWEQAVADALPAPEPTADVIQRAERDLLKRAAKYFADQKHAAMLMSIETSESQAASAHHRGRHDAFDVAGLYLLSMLQELGEPA
jgi:hypothetical protein